MADTWGGSWGTAWGVSWGTSIVPPPQSTPIPGSGGGHKRRRGPRAQLLVNNNTLEGRTKYDGIEELLKKKFLEPEERVIPLEEVRQIIRPMPFIIEPTKPKAFTLGDNEEIRAKLEKLKSQLTITREEYSEDEVIALLLLST